MYDHDAGKLGLEHTSCLHYCVFTYIHSVLPLLFCRAFVLSCHVTHNQ